MDIDSPRPVEPQDPDQYPQDWPDRDERQISKLRKLLGQRAEETKIVKGVNLPTFRHLAWESGLRLEWKKEQKKDLCQKLRSWVSLFDHATRPSELTSLQAETTYPTPLPVDERTRAKGEAHVLGKSIMEAVGSDMKHTQVPSWITKPPINWGSPRRGKLSANHWEVIGTIHLVFTLIRLWGGPERSPRQWDMLTNYMDLVQAILLLTLKAVKPSDIASYDFYILRHLQRYKELYPHARINPIHHAALHAGDLLAEFGPILSRNAGHYERSIYHMQELNTNMKFGQYYLVRILLRDFIHCLFFLGQLEATFLVSSCRAANLLALLRHDAVVRKDVAELVEVYESYAAEDNRGTRLANLASALHPTDEVVIIGDRKTSQVDDRILSLLAEVLSSRYGPSSARPAGRNIRSVHKMAIRGVRYTAAKVIKRDSDVIFTPRLLSATGNNQNLDTCPGRISQIFTYHPDSASTSTQILPTAPEVAPAEAPVELVSVYVAIHPYGPLPDESSATIQSWNQSCREFGTAGGYLCSSTLLEDDSHLQVVEASDILCHFAKLSIPEHGLMHVLPLDRVRLLYCSHIIALIYGLSYHSYRKWLTTKHNKMRIATLIPSGHWMWTCNDHKMIMTITIPFLLVIRSVSWSCPPALYIPYLIAYRTRSPWLLSFVYAFVLILALAVRTCPVFATPVSRPVCCSVVCVLPLARPSLWFSRHVPFAHTLDHYTPGLEVPRQLIYL